MAFRFKQFIRTHASDVKLSDEEISFLPEDVADFHDDSRQLQDGDVYFACSGQGYHGADYVKGAIRKGAQYCVVSQDYQSKGLIEDRLIRVKDVNTLFGLASRNLFGKPDEELKIIGITGTNGKTSVAHLTSELLAKYSKIQVASIGTLGVFVNGKFMQKLSNTTPPAKTFYRVLRELVNLGVQYVVCEVSSHGLQLGRIQGCKFETISFLNLSHDHLEFHGDMGAYFEAKTSLFNHHHRYTWLNMTTSWGETLAERIKGDLSGVIGRGNQQIKTQKQMARKQVEVRGVQLTRAHAEIELEFTQRESRPQITYVICSQGLALFPDNLAMAVGIVSDICELPNKIDLTAFHLPGRYELYQGKSGQWVMVDYAHSPEALSALLQGIKRIYQGFKLIVVFGCGGDRDVEKRSAMGRVATKYADECILTSDNPRTEDPSNIIEDIKKGCILEKTTTVLDRGEAIHLALKNARKNDIVVIAGKGHEEVQIVGQKRNPFSDLGVCKPYLVNTAHLT